MRKAHVGDIVVVEGKFGSVFISRRSVISGKLHTICLGGVDIEQIVNWFQGRGSRLIQDEFPHLTAAEREFILSGATETEWEETFKDDEDPAETENE